MLKKKKSNIGLNQALNRRSGTHTGLNALHWKSVLQLLREINSTFLPE